MGIAEAMSHAPGQPQVMETPQVGKSWQSTSEERQRGAQERRGAERVGGKPSGGVQIPGIMFMSWRLLATVALQWSEITEGTDLWWD